jgi:transcriptional regulator with XRE-family HTH domain
VPLETRIFVRKYMDLTERVEALMAKKGVNRQQLAVALKQHPSAISRWLKNEQNLTLKSIAKLEAFFGEEIIVIQGETPPSSQPTNTQQDEILILTDFIQNKQAEYFYLLGVLAKIRQIPVAELAKQFQSVGR